MKKKRKNSKGTWTLGLTSATLRPRSVGITFIPSGKLFSNLTVHQTRFKYDIFGEFVDNSLLIKSQIQDVGFKGDWEYFGDPDNTYVFGGQAVYHQFRPNVIRTAGDINDVVASQEGERLNTTEWAIYAGNERVFWRSSKGRLWAQVYRRLCIRQKLFRCRSHALHCGICSMKIPSVKASYSVMRQYMHRVSSSSIALPTDLWYPVTRQRQSLRCRTRCRWGSRKRLNTLGASLTAGRLLQIVG